MAYNRRRRLDMIHWWRRCWKPTVCEENQHYTKKNYEEWLVKGFTVKGFTLNFLMVACSMCLGMALHGFTIVRHDRALGVMLMSSWHGGRGSRGCHAVCVG